MTGLAKTADIVPGRSQRWLAFRTLLGPALKAHSPIFALIVIQIVLFAGVYALSSGLTLPSLLKLALSVGSILGVILPLSIISIRFFHLTTKIKPKHPIPVLVRDVWDFVRQPKRMANGLPMVIAFIVFTFLFTELKGAIPAIKPFSWDVTFMEWDRWLHFGTDPWKLLAPILNYPPVTFLLTGIYHLWFMVMWILVTSIAFSTSPSAARTQFFLAFMLTWIVGGNIFAILLSSAGPCYFGLLGYSPDPYAPLLAYLHSVNEVLPIWALDTQTLLWDGYQGSSINLGISAMPSMHNGAALLFAFAGWRINRMLGAGLFVFTGLILIGSIHLGWHYAIDGYAGFAIALAAWWVSGMIAGWWETTRWAQDYELARRRVC